MFPYFLSVTVSNSIFIDKDSEESQAMSRSFAKVAPDFKGPITPEQSVKMQLEVLNRWTVENTGAFVSHFGTKQWL